MAVNKDVVFGIAGLCAVGSIVSSLYAMKLTQKIRQVKERIQETPEQKKSRELAEEWRERGVPRAFREVDPKKIQELRGEDILKTFQAIVKHCHSPVDKRYVVQSLNNIVTGKTGDETVGYVQERLGFDIFRSVTNRPYTTPLYVQFDTVEDIIKRNFMSMIRGGICAYKKADSETRAKFDKAVLSSIGRTGTVMGKGGEKLR